MLAPLEAARDLDEIARTLFSELSDLPGVRRVGLALTEGAGRRLLFLASDRDDTRDQSGTLDWCHIDAYEDVPLTAVVRSGAAVFVSRDGQDGAYAAFVELQPAEVRSVAAVPLPGIGSPMGGLLVFLDERWGEEQWQLLDELAGQVADAVRRVRVGSDADHEDLLEPGTLRLVLDDVPQSVRLARHFLRDFLSETGVSEDSVDTAQLCLSELATNAVMHTRGSYELRVALEADVLTVAVRDHGGEETYAEPNSDDDPLRVYGRGLQLVDALADRWGSERDGHGSTVWFALEVGTA